MVVFSSFLENCVIFTTSYDWQFVATFATSVLTGAFGVAKFMKLGPCKFIPKESGFMIGFASFGFPAVAWSIIVALLGKAFSIAIVSVDFNIMQALILRLRCARLKDLTGP